MQNQEQKFDICIIGAGSGGLTVSAVAAQLGVSVALIEKHKMGGDCLNYGCVPSKALIAAAKAATAQRTSGKYGITSVEPEVNWSAVKDHVQDVIEGIRPMDEAPRFEAMGATVLRGAGEFVDANTFLLNGTAIKARRFVVATGSGPMVPPIPGLADVPYLTNETLFEYRDPIEHLVVLGAGPIGLEMAQAHRRLGAKVTVIEMAKAMPRDDQELVQILLDLLRGEGIELFEGHAATAVAPTADGGIAVTAEGPDGPVTITGSHLLVAAGRQVNVEGLGLDKAGVDFDRRGIKVNASLRSSNKKIYAIGDVAGGPQFTHAAGYHAGIAIQNLLFRIPAKANNASIPWVTYCDPELAHVGLNEADAKAQHGEIRVLRWPFAENDRARAGLHTDGLVKVVTDKKGRILGASILGASAGELIQVWILAISKKMKIKDMASFIAPYPTLGEASKRAAGTFFADKLFSATTKRIVRFLAKFG